jgi:hypothetical protein
MHTSYWENEQLSHPSSRYQNVFSIYIYKDTETDQLNENIHSSDEMDRDIEVLSTTTRQKLRRQVRPTEFLSGTS